MKTKLASALMLGALLATGTASAALFSGSDAGWAGSYGGSGQVYDNVDGDVVFAYEASSLPLNTVISINELQTATADFYTVNLNFTGLSGGALATPGTYDISYWIDTSRTYAFDGTNWNDTGASSEYIYKVSVGADVPGATPGVDITKTLYDPSFGAGSLPAAWIGQLVSNSGSSPVFYTTGQPQGFYVTDHIVIGSGGYLASTTNTFEVRDIPPAPEPVTLSLLGLGLAAFGARRRFAA